MLEYWNICLSYIMLRREKHLHSFEKKIVMNDDEIEITVKCAEHWQTATNHEGFLLLREPLIRNRENFVPDYSNFSVEIFYTQNVKDFMVYHNLKGVEVCYIPKLYLNAITAIVENHYYDAFITMQRIYSSDRPQWITYGIVEGKATHFWNSNIYQKT